LRPGRDGGSVSRAEKGVDLVKEKSLKERKTRGRNREKTERRKRIGGLGRL